MSCIHFIPCMKNSLLLLLFTLAPMVASDAQVSPLAGFADPARASKLAAAYPELDRLMTEFATREHIPGAAWGIIVDGKLVHIGVTGYRDLAAKARVDSNTVFRIASMTKSFTAVAIMRLRDEGKLSLDDPAERYVSELAGLKYPTKDSPKITIRHLLSHAEGFPEDNPWGDQQLARTEEEMSEMMRRGIPFSTAPGTAYEYSNFGFAILGRIVTKASGMPYRTYIKSRVLDPLDLTSTTLDPPAVKRDRLAQGYRWEDEQWKIEPQLPDGSFGAMGGMLTSPRDLGIWVSTFLSAFPPSDSPETAPIRRASLREMQQVSRPRVPSVRRDASGTVRLASGGYGFGLRISSDCFFPHIVEHGGGLPGFGTLMRWLPDYGVGLIAFGNRTYSGWGRPFDDALAAMAKTGALQPRVPEPSPALMTAREAVSRLVVRWSDALADSIAANNLYLDRSSDRRRAELERFDTQVGPCRAATGFDFVENALRGSWIMPCERGSLRVAITLAPTMPPKVQYLEVRAVPPGGEPPRPGICALQ